jgi:hypothetical protein
MAPLVVASIAYTSGHSKFYYALRCHFMNEVASDGFCFDGVAPANHSVGPPPRFQI